MSRLDTTPFQTNGSGEIPPPPEVLKHWRTRLALRAANTFIKDLKLYEELGLNLLEKNLLRYLMVYDWLRKSPPKIDVKQSSLITKLLIFIKDQYSSLSSYNTLLRMSNMLLAEFFRNPRKYDREGLFKIVQYFKGELNLTRGIMASNNAQIDNDGSQQQAV